MGGILMNCPACGNGLMCPKCAKSQRIRQALALKPRGNTRSKWPAATRAKIIDMRDQGYSVAQIAEATGVPRSTTFRLLVGK